MDTTKVTNEDGREPGPFAVIQGRRDIEGIRLTGFECTVSVADLDATVAAAEATGGKALTEAVTIPTVGTLV